MTKTRNWHDLDWFLKSASVLVFSVGSLFVDQGNGLESDISDGCRSAGSGVPVNFFEGEPGSQFRELEGRNSARVAGLSTGWKSWDRPAILHGFQ